MLSVGYAVDSWTECLFSAGASVNARRATRQIRIFGEYDKSYIFTILRHMRGEGLLLNLHDGSKIRDLWRLDYNGRRDVSQDGFL